MSTMCYDEGMMSKVQDLKNKIQKRSDRRRKTFWISDSLCQEAKAHFEGISLNKVIEELLREALEEKRIA